MPSKRKISNRYRKKGVSYDPLVKIVSSTTSAGGENNNSANGNNGSNGKNNDNNEESNGNNNRQHKNNNGSANNNKFFYFPPEKRSLWPTDFFPNASQPYRLIHRNWRQELPHLFLVFFLVLLLYAFTTPHMVALEDDGLFISNMKFFGVAHPPGYPVHTFLGGIFYHILPFGTPAFKGHFFSGFSGAIGCAAIYAIVAMLVRGRIFGYAAGLAYGASKTFWSQAIIAEVYTLNAMFYFIILAQCITYSSHAGRSGRMHRRLLMIIAFTYGLAAANHYPILFLGSTGLGLLVFSQLRNILPNLPQVLFFLFIGIAPPYVWMVWRSFTITPANFYGPIEGWNQFLFYFLRSGYSGVDKQSGVGLEDKIAFAKFLGDEMLWQFTPVGLVFVIIGFFAMARSRYNWMWLSMTLSWFTSSVILVMLLDFKATFIWMAAFRVYHLLAYGIMAIWLALGAAWTVDRLRFFPLSLHRQLGWMITCAVVGFTIYSHWEINNRRDYSWAHDLAIAKINSVEGNAVLFTFDDLDLPVGYLHFVENVRPDLKVYNDQGLVYGDRLFSPLIGDFAPEGNPQAPNKNAVLKKFIEQTDRPIYYHAQRSSLYEHPKYGSDLVGFLRRVNRENNQDRIILSELMLEWLDKNYDRGKNITDLWTRQQHYSTVAQVVNTILTARLHGYELDEKWLEVIDRAKRANPSIRIADGLHNINSMTEAEMEREFAWTNSFDVNSEELLEANMRAHFYLLRANLVSILKDPEDPEYEQSLLIGLDQDKNINNPALVTLLNYYHNKERFCDYINLADRFYTDTSTIPIEILRNLRQARKKVACT